MQRCAIAMDLQVYATERDGVVGMKWLYRPRSLDEWRMAQLARHYERVVAAMVSQPHVAVGCSAD